MRSRSALLVAALAVGGLLVGGLAACTPPKKVFVIGDSLTVGAVQRGLGTDTDAVDWTVQAKVGRTTHSGTAIVADRDLHDYDLVIVALGTNDYLDSAETYGARIDQMMAAIDPGPDVVWMTVDTNTDKLAAAADGVNAALAAAPARHARLAIADWDEHVRTLEGFDACRAGDQVHYQSCGYDERKAFTEWLAGA